MSVPNHQRESQECAAALLLAFVDPIGAIIASIAIAHYSYLAVYSLLHHGGGYRPFAVIFFLGAALVVASPTALFAPIARGIGVPSSIFVKARGKSLAFWLGVALIISAYVPVVTEWVQRSVPFFDYTGTAVLCMVSLLAFCVGGSDAIAALSDGFQAATAYIRVTGKNRTRRHSLTGQLLLCGGVSRGTFQERNVTEGAPAKGELLLYGEQSVRRGTIVIGAPGSSKTRSKVYPDFYWGLQSSPRAGALVFVTKRRATQDCYRIARTLRPADHIHVVGIGPDRETMDVTAGMTHESIGDAIQDGLGASHSDFWRHGPSAFVEGFIEIVHALAPATIQVQQSRIKTAQYNRAVRPMISRSTRRCRRCSSSYHSMRAVSTPYSRMALTAHAASRRRVLSKPQRYTTSYRKSKAAFFPSCNVMQSSERNYGNPFFRSCNRSPEALSETRSATDAASISRSWNAAT